MLQFHSFYFVELYVVTNYSDIYHNLWLHFKTCWQASVFLFFAEVSGKNLIILGMDDSNQE